MSFMPRPCIKCVNKSVRSDEVCSSIYSYLQGPHHLEVGGMGSLSLKQKASHLKQEMLLFGRTLEAEKLHNLITSTRDGDKPHVVSVWGVTGVGKSTLLRSVYYQCMIDRNFDWYGWFDVPHPFNLVSLSRSILLRMCPESLQTEDPIQECQKLLQQDRYLLVINGLQSKEVWDLINAKLICKASRSCVVVITMEESIATHCAVTDTAVCHVKGLDVDAALDLFRKVCTHHLTPSVHSSIRSTFLIASFSSLICNSNVNKSKGFHAPFFTRICK